MLYCCGASERRQERIASVEYCERLTLGMHQRFCWSLLNISIIFCLLRSCVARSERPEHTTTTNIMTSSSLSSSSNLAPIKDMPLLPITSPETVTACRNLEVSPEHDIFICSYPKSGTTWTQNLVCQLLAANVGMTLSQDTWHLSHSAPFYEVDQYWEHSDDDKSRRVPAHTPIQNSNTCCRVFNTHLRPNQLPRNAKCVYVLREPLDVLASFYYHLANMAPEDGGYEGTPEEFCHAFVDGTILYGKWQDHLESWLGSGQTYTNDNEQQILFLHYDDMKEDLERETTKLATFLGIKEDRLRSVVSQAIPHCTFRAMKDNRWKYTPRSVNWKIDSKTGKAYADFIREGRIGDGLKFWKAYAPPKLQKEWKTVVAETKIRWKIANVDEDIIRRYLGNDEEV